MKNFFKNFFSMFKKAWFWWLFGLLVLCAIIWFLFPLMKFGSAVPFASRALRLAIILVLVIAWAIINIILARRAKDNEEDTTDPEKVRRALSSLKHNFSKACEIVAQGSWGKKYIKQHAYSLPWYLTLGAPQSGRSSLLRQSGLPYPVANESYQQLEQGEDELCQFWFSKSAVFIDTQDNLLTETAEDSVPQRVYLELLDLLKQYRRKQPLNGVVLCIDVYELMHMNDTQRANRVHLLRTQLQILNNLLGIQCPIYICFTKADLLSGFSEYFSDLDEADQEQAFGFTLPYHANRDSVKSFSDEYDQLVHRLNEQLLSHLQTTKNARDSALVNNFPTQMQIVKECLQQFLTDAFEANHYQQAHAVRGVFFTSSAQHGVPLDCLQEASEKTYGIDIVNEQENVGKKVFFIKGLFEKIIFPEKNILLFNALQSKRQSIWRYASFVLTATVILLFVYLWGNSFMYNKEALQAVNQSVTNFQAIPANLKEKNSRLMHVLPMLNELRQMRAVFDPENDLRDMRWGLYQGEKVDAVAEEMYRKNLSIYFLPYIVDVAVAELNNPNAKANQTYNALRVYLMLANPEKMAPSFMQNWLHTYWRLQYPDQNSKVASLVANLNAFLQMKIKPITVDQDLVKKARIKLQDTTQAQRDYFELQELAAAEQGSQLYISNGVNLDFNQVFGKPAAKLSVPSLYTFKGYNEIYKTQLQKVLENEGFSDWVLGEYAQKSLSDEADSSEIAEQVRAFYMRDYISHWSGVIDSLSITKFSTLTQARNILAILSGANSPIYDVLNTVKTNTELNPKASASGGSALAGAGKFLKKNKRLVKAVQPKALKKVTGKAKRFVPKGGKGGGSVDDIENPLEKTPVGIHFTNLDSLLVTSGEGEKAESPYTKIQLALEKLSEFVTEINNASNKDERAYQLVIKRIEGADNEDAIGQLLEQAKAAPQPVRGWLIAVANNTWSALLSSARDYISERYQKELYPDYQKSVQNRAPFSAKAKEQVSMSMFTEFFAADGEFDKFFTKYLLPFIDVSQPKWVWKPVDGQTLPVSNDVLLQLQRAVDIKNAFFGEDGKTLKVAYILKVKSLSANLKSAILMLNGESLVYRHGPKRSVTFNWPGQSLQNNYSLSLESLNNMTKRYSENGVWGVFKLFQSSKMRTNSRNSNLAISYDGVSYELKAESALNPFSPNLLPVFRLPENLEAK